MHINIETGWREAIEAWVENDVLPRFGLDGRARMLGGYEDANLLVEREASSRLVVKVSGTEIERKRLELQSAVLARVGQRLQGFEVPSAIAAPGGEEILRLVDPWGETRLVRVLTFVEGNELGTLHPVCRRTRREIGKLFGRLGRVLQDFEHAGKNTGHEWDLVRFPEVAPELLPFVHERRVRDQVERSMASYDGDVRPKLERLRWQVIHGDGNEKNLIVGRGSEAEEVLRGLIDFGDTTFSVRVAEVAIAATYAAMGDPYPIRAAADVVAGYHHENPLDELEISVLASLVRARAATSVLMAARVRAAPMATDHHLVSETVALELLEYLDEFDGDLTTCFFRHACGLEPHPRNAPIRARMEREAVGAARVLPDCDGPPGWAELDLDVASSTVYRWTEAETREAFRGEVQAAIRSSPSCAAIGRYGERRLLYSDQRFRGRDGATRTVHLGIDVFAPPGSPVHAPIAGIVHSAALNSGPLDYGPTIILRHDGEEDTFFTLYGHLSVESLDQHEPGARVSAGDLIGMLGEESENGGWPPHLHFQVIADTAQSARDFAGVCEPRDFDVYHSVCPDPSLLLGLSLGKRADDHLDAASILELRGTHVGPSLSIAYLQPLHIVRGIGAHLYDADGQGYLDLVNNVAHVGHSNPRVVEAVNRQTRLLNTNTRYLHANLVRYAERLTGLLPSELSVCYFTCSGSEANDLALRLAAAHTGGTDVIVLEGAYHGNLSSLIEISPYKFDGRGGSGAPTHVRTVPIPDCYRGPHRGYTEDSGRRYAGYVADALQALGQEGRTVSAFFCESIPGCAGQVVLPPGYLKRASDLVRGAGGVYVADEVQVGFGRAGERFWGFELQGVVPDIVTLGKPIGNGYPIGAVVTTAAIAASFDTGMEYFNTFGGNPVACSAGLAVLDVLEEEGLQERALRLGRALQSGLRELQARHDCIGDVRGAGLFLGVELVNDPESQAPAPRAAAYLAEQMRDRHVLLSTDGPYANVLKIKPPMVLEMRDVNRMLTTFEDVLGHSYLSDSTYRAA